MVINKVVSNSPAETEKLGQELAPLLEKGDVISLEGELGAGKTIFIKGIAAGLGIKDAVTSPTFIILRQYDNRLQLNHFDAYRVSEKEFADLGYRDFFYSHAVSIIEWGDRIKNLLPDEVLIIDFEHGKENNQRILTVKPKGKTWKDKAKKWLS